MTKHMQRDIDDLQNSILRMAGYVEEAIFSAIHALQQRNPDAAKAVIDKDPEIDQLENEVQEDCLKMFALYQPVAVDLRRISAVLLISTDLERMGDLAVGIAERALTLSHPPYIPIPPRLIRMMEQATKMVRQSLDSFVNLDAQSARQVVGMDEAVDADNDHIIKNLIMEMKDMPTMVEQGLSMFSAVRHLERIADHATNIAEDVIYLVEGRLVRHHRDVQPSTVH